MLAETKRGLPREATARETHESAVMNFKISEQYGYKFIMEVKKIRDERYYKELGYSNFDDYCQDAWGVDKWYMNERIKIADEFGEEKSVVITTSLGHRKSLLLARMPEDHREEVIEKGIPTEDGNKPIEEAKQQEIREYMRKLREEKERNERLEKEKTEAEREAAEARRRLANVKPTIVEREVVREVVPDGVKKRLQEIEKERDELDAALSQTYARVRQLEKLERSVQHQAQSPLYDMYRSLMSVEGYLQAFTEDERMSADLVSNADKEVVDKVSAALNRVIKFAENARDIVEGENVTIIEI